MKAKVRYRAHHIHNNLFPYKNTIDLKKEYIYFNKL